MTNRHAQPRQFRSAWPAGFADPAVRQTGEDATATGAPETAVEAIPQWASPQARAAGLTPREWEVLTLLIVGYSTKEIAAHLCVSYHTAVRHIARLRAKFGVTARAQVVARALGITLPPPPSMRPSTRHPAAVSSHSRK